MVLEHFLERLLPRFHDLPTWVIIRTLSVQRRLDYPGQGRLARLRRLGWTPLFYINRPDAAV